MKTNKIVFAALTAMGIGAVTPAHAELAAKGLPHAVNKFPVWFKDSHNITLELCIEDGNPLCIFDPVIAGNDFSNAIGFGAEAFWWMADTRIGLAGGGSADLVLALEAAFGQEVPKDGDQFAFGRVRIRIDAPVSGKYKIWHPYLAFPACQPEEYEVTAGTRAINVTRDIGGAAPFDSMLQGEVGPFLIWDPQVLPLPPAGYVGDPAVPHSVVGSPCGFNFFKVEGPGGSDIGGAQGSENVVESWDFNVMGKIYNNVTTPPPVVIDRANYFRNAAGTAARLNVWAQSDPYAVLTRSGQPGPAQSMEKDNDGHFYNRRSYSNANCLNLKSTVSVTAVNAGNLTTTRTLPLTDTVKVTTAVFSPTLKTLKIVAETSDQYRPANPNPSDALNGVARKLTARTGTRTAEMIPDATVAGRYAYTFDNVMIPSPEVVVTSDLGGSDSEVVVP